MKNPHQFVSSFLNPSILDGLVYSFMGPDARNLAAVHIPALAFETTVANNVLDDPVIMHASLEALLANQMFHPYVNMGMPNMLSSSCRQANLLLVKWHIRFAHDYPFGISLKAFYDAFLAPLGPAKAQPYSNIFAW